MCMFKQNQSKSRQSIPFFLNVTWGFRMTKAAPRGLLMLQSETNTHKEEGQPFLKVFIARIAAHMGAIVLEPKSYLNFHPHVPQTPPRASQERQEEGNGFIACAAVRRSFKGASMSLFSRNECIHNVLESHRGIISAPRHHIKPDTRSLRGKQWRLVSTKASTGGGTAQVGFCSAALRDVL